MIRTVKQAEPAKIRTVLLSYLRYATNLSLRADIENLLQSIGGGHERNIYSTNSKVNSVPQEEHRTT